MDFLLGRLNQAATDLGAFDRDAAERIADLTHAGWDALAEVKGKPADACPICGGLGRLADAACDLCDATGRVAA